MADGPTNETVLRIQVLDRLDVLLAGGSAATALSADADNSVSVQLEVELA